MKSGAPTRAAKPCHLEAFAGQILEGRFGEFDESEERVIERSGDAEFAAFACDEAVKGIDFGAFAAHHVLRSGAARGGHLFGNFVSAGEGDLWIFKAGWLNAGSFCDGEDFVDGAFEELPGVGAGDDFAVGDFAESGERVERAIPNELGPEFAGDVFGDAAGNVRAEEDFGDTARGRIFGAEDQIATTDMLNGAGRRDGGGDIDDGGQSVETGGGVNLFGVVDAVLHADEDGVRRNEGCEFFGGGSGVGSFYAKQNDFGVARGREIGGCGCGNAFLELSRVEE